VIVTYGETGTERSHAEIPRQVALPRGIAATCADAGAGGIGGLADLAGFNYSGYMSLFPADENLIVAGRRLLSRLRRVTLPEMKQCRGFHLLSSAAGRTRC
jgi:hypothetical protein